MTCEGFPVSVLAILQYGSSLDKTKHQFSDVDICVVAPKIAKEEKEKLWRNLSNKDKTDVKFFEDLPVILKHDIIERHKAIHVKSEEELLEYFLYWEKVYQSFAPHYKTAKKTIGERLAQWKLEKK